MFIIYSSSCIEEYWVSASLHIRCQWNTVIRQESISPQCKNQAHFTILNSINKCCEVLCLNVEHFHLDEHKAHCDGVLGQLVHSTVKRPNQCPQTWVDVHFIEVQAHWCVCSLSILRANFPACSYIWIKSLLILCSNAFQRSVTPHWK